MNRLFTPFLSAVLALGSTALLSACGGGGSSNTEPAQPPAAQTISFASPGNQSFGVTPADLVATASSGLTVSFSSATPGVCSVSGAKLTLTGVGTCTVAATQSGSAAFLAASVVSNSFSVVAGPQTVSFVSPGNQNLGSAPIALIATATSGLTVSFASSTPGVCIVNGSTLTLVAAGTCTVNAAQTGNANFVAAAAVERSVTISVAPLLTQTITFAALPGQNLGTAPFALVATSTSNLSVAFASTTTGICTVSGKVLSLLGVGICTVVASQPGDSGYAAAVNVLNTFNVAAAAQSITFVQPVNQTFGTAAAALSATASSGLPVVFTSTTPSVCSVSGTALSLLSAGNCAITAGQSGNASFAAATTVSRSFSVLPAGQTINFTSPGNQTLGTTPAALSATSTSGLAVSFMTTTPSVCTVSGTALTLVAVGSCTVNASQAGNGNYAAAVGVSNTFSVAALPLTAQSITFAALSNQTVGTTPPALAATASSGLTVLFASTTPSVCTVSGTTITLVAAGTCTVTASQPGNATYAAATVVSNSFTVAVIVLPPQTITFTSPGNQILGTAPGALSATASSGLPVTFASTTSTVCTVSGTTLTLRSVGTCTVTASQAGNAIFSAAPVVSYSVTVDGIELFANGGFETVGVTTPANAWLQAASGYTRSTDSRSGTYAAQLASVQQNAAIILQNSVDQGNRPPLVLGSTPILTFWAKGTAGATGSLTFSLRFLDGTGNILYNSFSQNFGAAINTTTYTKITFTGGVVPVGATAAFLEFSQAIGPIGTGPAGENWFAGKVLIDDLSLMVLTAP
jgi:hypothetical protein